MENKNHRVIQVKYLAATNTKGNRVVLREHNTRKVIPLKFRYGLKTAVEYLEGIGINVVGHGLLGDSHYIFSDSWADGEGFITIKNE